MKKMMKKRIDTFDKIRLSVFALWLAVAAMCIGSTPWFFHYAYAMRGYRAIGGECLVPLIPFIFMPAFMDLSDALCTIANRMMKKKKASLSYAPKG